MIGDAKAKKIDLILTKSLSRFARNTIDCLTVIRELRAINVDIFFEKENLYSSDPKVDFMLTIFSSIAQEESRNISENIKWGYRKRFKEGKVTINTSRFLGYDKDKDGKIVINPEEAKTVRMIFNLYIAGETTSSIAKMLLDNKIQNGRKVVTWYAATVDAILMNEKYCGDVILQKNVVVDYLTHRSIPNDGIVPKYYISNNHEGIVTKEMFEAVQQMRKNRHGTNTNSKYGNHYPLSGFVHCGDCGRVLNRHYYNYGDANQRIVLSCKNTRLERVACSNKPIDYDTLIEAIRDLINTMRSETPALVDELLEALEKNIDREKTYEAIQAKREAARSIENDIRKLIDLRLDHASDSQAKYYDVALEDKHALMRTINEELKILQVNLSEGVENQKRLEGIKTYLEGSNPVTRAILEALFSEILAVSQTEIHFILNESGPETGLLLSKVFTSPNTNRTLILKVYAKEEPR